MSDYTCSKCGKPMRFNVPRLGLDGGFVHADTGRLVCGDISEVLGEELAEVNAVVPLVAYQSLQQQLADAKTDAKMLDGTLIAISKDNERLTEERDKLQAIVSEAKTVLHLWTGGPTTSGHFGQLLDLKEKIQKLGTLPTFIPEEKVIQFIRQHIQSWWPHAEYALELGEESTIDACHSAWNFFEDVVKEDLTAFKEKGVV